MYRRRAETACEAARLHLAGLAKFIEPRAGMFMWLEFTGKLPCAHLKTFVVGIFTATVIMNATQDTITAIMNP